MRKYSDSEEPLPGGAAGPLTLAVDGGSPLVSLAVGAGTDVLAETSFAGGPSSPSLLGQVDRLLASIACRPGDLGRLIGARGPGSFTGLRGALATLLGLHQALAIPATAVASFQPLASQANGGQTVVAAIDALRGELYVQAFEAAWGTPLCEPMIVAPERLRIWKPCTVVAFGSRRIAAALGAHHGIEFREARPLAVPLLTLAANDDLDWDAALLSAPLYLRPPATSRPMPKQAT